MSSKGSQIIVTGHSKKYCGWEGWINTAKGKGGYTDKMVNVIIYDPKQSGQHEERVTRLNKKSVKVKTMAKTREEATLMKRPKVDASLDETIRLLVKCSIGDTEDSMNVITAIFMARLERGHADRKKWKEANGSLKDWQAPSHKKRRPEENMQVEE